MAIDARIPLGINPPVQGPNPLEMYQTIAQVQAVREQTEARRAAAEEARTKLARQKEVDEALQQAITVDQTSGRITIDKQKVMAHLPQIGGAQALKLQDLLDDNETKANALVDARTQSYLHTQALLGSLSQRVVAAQGDPAQWREALRTAKGIGALPDEQYQELVAITDPADITRRAQGYVDAVAGNAKLEKITTVNAAGETVEQFVVPKAGASYVQPTKTSPLSYQAHDVLLDGRPTSAAFNPQTGTYHVGGQDVTARVRPIPPQGPGPEPIVSVMGPDGKPVYVTRSQALGRTPGSAEAGGFKLSAAQQEDVATMMTVQQLASDVKTLGTQTKWTGVGPVEGRIGNTPVGYGGVQGETLRNLIGNIQGTIAKLRGGTSFTPSEQALLETYTPTTTDTETKITAKLASLASFIEKKRQNTLRVAAGQYAVPGAGDAGAAAPPPPAAGKNPFRK